MADLNRPRSTWRRAIVFPREHGAWAMFAMPMLSGAAIGYLSGGRAWSSVALITLAAVAGFLLRTPAEALAGLSIIRPANPRERTIAIAVVSFWALVAGFAVFAFSAHAGIWPLFLPAAAAVAPLVAQLLENNPRQRLFQELLGAVALSSSAFASYYAISGRIDKAAAAVWLVNALFSLDQVMFVRWLIRRVRAAPTNPPAQARAKRMYASGSLACVLILLVGAGYSVLPLGAILAYVPLLARAWWVERHTVIPNLRAVGWREMMVSTISVSLLIAAFAVRVR